MRYKTNLFKIINELNGIMCYLKNKLLILFCNIF
jgi:hypothetical protein